MIDISNLTIEQAHADLKEGKYAVKELCQAYLDVIKEKNDDINAYLEVFEDVMEQAENAQKRFSDGSATLLTGIPVAIKDNMLVAGRRVSAASKILEGYVAPYTATALQNMLDRGAVFLGRTNMDEFAMGSSVQTSAYGITRNPLDRERVPGGSSGGSSAAVAMHGALVALGSETCGSIRQPAAYTGLVGFKPTYGSVSRSGLISMANSLDQICPLSRTVRDAEIVHEALASKDSLDATTVDMEKRTPKERKEAKKIAIPKDVMEGKGMDKEVYDSFIESIELFKNLGYEIVEREFPLMPYSLAVYYIVMPAELSTNLERFDGIRYGYSTEAADTLFDFYAKTRGEGFGRESRRRILLGTYVLSHGYYDAYYKKAVMLRDLITKELDEAFNDVDFYITPTAPTLPFKIGEKLTDPVAMYYSDVFSAPANISGCPAIALPTKPTKEGLPTSVQVTAPHWRDKDLFTLGKKFEELVQ